MKTKIFSMIALLGAMTVASCGDNWEPNVGGGEGSGTMSLSGINVVNGEKIKNVKSRADISTDNFIVEVEDANGKQLGSWIYGQMPELIDLPTGTGYKVNVKSHEQQPQAWDMPYYEGESDVFDIENNKITPIGTVTARFSNIAVTINYTNEMKLAMGADCKVTVVANKNGQLEFTPTETRTGYFEALADSPTLVATFSGTINGVTAEVTKIYKDVVAGNHYYITFGYKGPDSTIPEETGDIEVDASGITIDMDVDNNDVPGNVIVDEDVMDGSDRPGKEDPKEPDVPDDPVTPDDPTEEEFVKFETDKNIIDLDKVNEIVDGNPYVVNIITINPIADLMVEIDSPSLDADGLSEVGLVPTFSLAYPGNLETALKGLGFKTGDEIIGQTELEFDITKFVPLIPMVSEKGQIHNFIITVTDNQGNKGVAKLTFKS